jgi:glycosyltransferase involved in cell wall biosynthesis
MVISFVWNDKNRIGWDDGLMKALDLLPYEVTVYDYYELDKALRGDIIMWWSDLTHKQHEVLEKTKKPKLLFLAGGPHITEKAKQWDYIFTETEHDYRFIKETGVSTEIAFGTNTEIFYPENQPKIWDAIFPASYAKWKRQDLFSTAVKDKGLTCGHIQPNSDRDCYKVCVENGTLALPEVRREVLRGLYNASRCTLITSDKRGGSDRTVLESMACNIPVIVMKDARDLIHYVTESGFGKVCEPTISEVRKAVQEVKEKKWGSEGREYVLKNWSEKIYADKITKAIEQCLESQ